jgi:hypothetical protein
MGEGRLLERYRAEIVDMLRQRKTQVQIRRHLENKYDTDIPKSTLTDFVHGLRETGAVSETPEPRVTPEEEHFLEQYEVYESLQRSSEEMLDATSRMLVRMKNLDDAMRERTDGILEALQTVLDAVEPRAEGVSWARALLIAGAFWAVLLVIGTALYLAPWR